MRYTYFVGIDISAKSAESTLINSRGEIQSSQAVAQSMDGFQKLSERLLEYANPSHNVLVVMEATGNYWIKLALYLHDQGFHVSVVNPVRVHHFGRLHLKKAKTDQLDACLLAEFGRIHQPECWTPPPQIYPILQQHLAQRDSFLQIRTQIKNQIHALKHHQPMSDAVLRRYRDEIAHLDDHIKSIDLMITELLTNDPTWKQSTELLTSIPGLGFVTAAWILVTTLNFTSCETAEEAAAYAGLVPYPRYSGNNQTRHYGIGRGGNARLRTALYMATLSGNQHNPILRTFYQRLVARGKHKKVARCASARKLMHIAWAVVRKQQPFDPAYAA